MSNPAAIAGTYADLRFVKSRKVAQVTVEIPLEAADEFVRMFGAPNPAAEIPVALARLDVKPPQPKAIENRRSWSDMSLAQQAGIRCGEPDFWRFLGAENAEDAARKVRLRCRVNSRAELDKSGEAAERWRYLDSDYYAWLRGAA